MLCTPYSKVEAAAEMFWRGNVEQMSMMLVIEVVVVVVMVSSC